MFDPTECTRLIAEAREDDERMMSGQWAARDVYVYRSNDPRDRRQVCRIPTAQADDRVTHPTAAGIARTRNNLSSLADQLAAAAEEVERLREKVSDMRSEAVRAKAEVESLRLAAHHSRCDLLDQQAERDRLRDEVERMRAVYEAAKEWRKSVDARGFIMNNGAHLRLPLIRAIDAALAAEKGGDRG